MVPFLSVLAQDLAVSMYLLLQRAWIPDLILRVWWTLLLPFWLEMDSVLIVAVVMAKPGSLGDERVMLEVSHTTVAKVCTRPEFSLVLGVSVVEEVALQRCTMMVNPSAPRQNLSIKNEIFSRRQPRVVNKSLYPRMIVNVLRQIKG
jgi:hypothetical protein